MLKFLIAIKDLFYLEIFYTRVIQERTKLKDFFEFKAIQQNIIFLAQQFSKHTWWKKRVFVPRNNGF